MKELDLTSQISYLTCAIPMCTDCSVRHVSRRAACVCVLLCHECILWHDTSQCRSAISGVPFGCFGLLIWRHVLSIVDTRCFLLCADNVLASMLELDVHPERPGCCGQAYMCLQLYAFEHDDVSCWPACTRCTPANSCAMMNRRSQPTMSSANVSVNHQRICHLMTWTVCTSTVIAKLVAVHL